jgi:protease I
MGFSLADINIAILAANGFDENNMTAVQRSLTKMKIPYKIIAPEQGLVNGWQDSAWGHYFTVDAPIGTALGSDFNILILVGGERGVAKLKTNPHAKRIINHFIEAKKPLAAIGAGVSLLALSPAAAGLRVAAPDETHPDLVAAGIKIENEDVVTDGAVLTSDGSDEEAWIKNAMLLIGEETQREEQAAA